MNLTAEQQAVLDHPPEGVIKILAGAGSGKTSTLVRYAERWRGKGLYLAFNKAIASEAEKVFPSNIHARTVHSHALRALHLHGRDLVNRYRSEHLDAFGVEITAIPGMTRIQVRAELLRTINRFIIDEGDKLGPTHCLVENPKQRRAITQLAGKVLKRILPVERHDLPITHDTYVKRFEMARRIEGYDYLMLDEAQDLNPVLISIARKAGIPTLVVGDPNQSIYRFRGAVDAMDAFDVEALPLSRSWRFGERLAALVNDILQHHSQPPEHRLRGNPAIDTEILRYAGKVATGSGTAILARTNARLFESLAAVRRPFHVVGGIADLREQLRSAHDLRLGKARGNPHESLAGIHTWGALEHRAKDDHELRRLQTIVERHGADLPGLLNNVADLHRDSEADAQIVVATAHKAKGREWDAVVLLDDFQTPATLVAKRRADDSKTVEIDQEINLLYVACTRARRSLHLAPRLFDELL